MRELASLLNNMLSHSNVDHNDTFQIAATRWQVLKEVRFDLTCAGAEILWQHMHARAQGTLKKIPDQTHQHRCDEAHEACGMDMGSSQGQHVSTKHSHQVT